MPQKSCRVTNRTLPHWQTIMSFKRIKKINNNKTNNNSLKQGFPCLFVSSTFFFFFLISQQAQVQRFLTTSMTVWQSRLPQQTFFCSVMVSYHDQEKPSYPPGKTCSIGKMPLCMLFGSSGTSHVLQLCKLTTLPQSALCNFWEWHCSMNQTCQQ